MADTQTKSLSPEEYIKQLEAQLAAQNEVISGQAAQLKSAEAQADPNRVVVTHEGKNYLVRARTFQKDGLPVTAAELKDNADLVKELVEAQSGLLELIGAAPAEAKKSTAKGK